MSFARRCLLQPWIRAVFLSISVIRVLCAWPYQGNGVPGHWHHERAHILHKG